MSARQIMPRLYLCLLAPMAGLAGLDRMQDLSAQAHGAVYDEVEAVSRRAASGTRADLAATLTRAYPSVTPDVRETITVVLGLNALVDRREREVVRFREHLLANFPDSRYRPLLEPSTHSAPCRECEATGRRQIPCSTCNGSGKCRRCGGRGSLPRMGGGAPGARPGLSTSSRSISLSGGAVNRPIGGTLGDGVPEGCIVCKGDGKCKGCGGQKTVEAPCPGCQGRGQIPADNLRPMFSEMLVRLADRAFVSGQLARGRALFDGKWLGKDDFARATRQRREEIDTLAWAAEDAMKSENFSRAREILEQAVARFSAEPLAWHARELLALLNGDEAARRTWSDIADDVRMAGASAADQIPLRINMTLDTRRLEGVSPESLLAPEAAANLPAAPLAWRLEAPLVIGRTARVPVTIDRATPSGLRSSSRWTFFMVHTASGWRIVRLDPA